MSATALVLIVVTGVTSSVAILAATLLSPVKQRQPDHVEAFDDGVPKSPTV